MRTTKYNSATGAVIWSVTFESSPGVQDDGFGVAIGPDNNPVVTGLSCADVDCTTAEVRTIKYDGATGAVIWNITFDNGTGDTDQEAWGIAVGADGHPVFSENSCANDGTCRITVVKVNGATGAVIWTTTFSSGAGVDVSYGVAIGPDGHPVISGQSCDAALTTCDFRTIKFNTTTGSVIWNVVFDSGSDITPPFEPTSEGGFRVGIGADGNPMVTGHSCFAAGCDVRTIKYDGTNGSVLWNVTFDSGGGSDDVGTGVKVGADGHAVLTGFTCPTPGGFSCHLRLMKLDSATGATIFNTTFPSLGPNDGGNGVAIGQDGNPVVAGGSCDGTSSDPCDSLTVKFVLHEETPAGSTVPVDLNGGSSVPNGLSITYSDVATAGTTSTVSTTTAPPAPSGFNFIGSPPIFYDITTTATFSGPTQVCLNYAGRSFTPPESSLKLLHYEGGQWVDVTTLLDTTAKIICGSTTSLSPFAIAQPSPPPVTFSPVSIWLGLQKGNDKGLRFDVRADLYRNGALLVASGQLNNVPGGGPGFGNAGLVSIAVAPNGTPSLPSGSTLSVTISIRNACASSGPNAGEARLWFGDAGANSRFAVTMGSTATYYLHNGFTLTTTAGNGKSSLAVESGAKCSPFKPFGTWSTTLP